MFHSSMFVLFCLTWWRLVGVFGQSLSVMEGESITLKTNVIKIAEDEDILWKYGAKKSLIAEISRAAGIFCTFDDVPNGRFRDRLKLDDQTGSLTITNITTEHAGDYELLISGAKRSSKIFSVSVFAPLPTPNITRDSSQCSSSSSSSSKCSLVCSVLDVSHVTLSWYKRISLLSSISVSRHNRSLSLEVKFHDKNAYSCVVNNSINNQTQHLNITQLCHRCADQGLPLLYIVLISAAAAGSLLIVAVVVTCCICRTCKKTVETQEEDRTDSALCKPRTRQKKSKTESVYENIPKKR